MTQFLIKTWIRDRPSKESNQVSKLFTENDSLLDVKTWLDEAGYTEKDRDNCISISLVDFYKRD